MICMAALLVMAMSCKKNEDGNIAEGKGFRASMEAQTGDSKTHLEGSSVKWDSGDAIRVVNGAAQAACFDFTTNAVVGQDGCVVFEPSGQGFDARFFQPNYTAYYPAGIYNHATGKVTLPDTQTYAKVNKDDSSYDSFGKGCNPMVAKSEDERLNFKHLCGILALPLKGTCTVASIKLTALNNNVKLWGEGTVTYNDNDEPVLTLNGNIRTDANSITMNCGENGVPLNATTATTFYFVIPAGVDLGGISVELTDKAGNVWNHSTPTMEMSIPRKTLASMAEITVETYNPNIPTGAISGEFTINSNEDKVYFSRGNLQYRAKGGIGGDACTEAEEANIQPGQSIGGTWRFAEHQWDIVGTTTPTGSFGNVYDDNGVRCDNRSASRTYTGWVDLFGWGCNGIKHDNSDVWSEEYPYRDRYYSHYRPWEMNYYNITSGQTNNDGYGPSTTNDDGNLRINNGADWGVNPIINGGNQSNQWRTLTMEEWTYVMKTRKVGQNNDQKAYTFVTLKVDPSDANKNVYGILLFYDGYTGTIPSVDSKIEAIPEGCVFLPAAGTRDKPYQTISCGNINEYCAYYTATQHDYANAYKVWMKNGYEFTNSYSDKRPYSCAVRLVQDKPTAR